MNQENGTVLKTKNKQPVKAISYPDLYLLKETLEQLKSWTAVLELLDEFFSNRLLPIDKKKIIKEFYFLSRIYGMLIDDFSTCTDDLENQVEKLMVKEKVKISQ
ncbi:hypothetical protein ACWOC1_07805 [Enterococcus quebecensis]|uniref:Uncharacterized protein n=1 Tax=Enterococcus quebecensis TaxID=903983 RepID=A0A1E5GUK0_9ENTE|nr:hypothetical protein [Enterococcus quebecensis]OEG16366.1 hypothetical protein BCR23_05610 [Enterococcus quebecensis]OJG72764.1 hypothetical protein RV12_GL000862 [Enterococcus quebecensis]